MDPDGGIHVLHNLLRSTLGRVHQHYERNDTILRRTCCLGGVDGDSLHGLLHNLRGSNALRNR